MLFRLGVEQRARQLGVMGAIGFSARRLRNVSLLEGLILAGIGGVIGLAGAIAYTAFIVHGLRTWWVGAVGTTALHLYVEPMTLVIGLVSAFAVAMGAILWGAWRVGRTPSARLLAGSWDAIAPAKRKPGRLMRILGGALAAAGVVILALVSVGALKPPEMALMGGAALLCGGLCWLSALMRSRRHEAAAGGSGVASVTRLGIRNASRHTARSVLSVGLIAFAVFTLIVVAAMRRSQPSDTGDKASGAGGYRLFIRANVPLLGDLNTPAGRKILAVRENDDAGRPLWADAHFMSLRRWAGEDISCLNLAKPGSPTILAVPHAMVERGGFTFADQSEAAANLWSLLEAPAGDTLPVIADAETAEYILHVALGGEVLIHDASGRPRRLRLVATLGGSIFQGELLMGEGNFRELFPSQAGFGVILGETGPERVRAMSDLLNAELGDYAVSVETTAARLASYQEIANTYLSTFQTLGSLGLMLGTIGLGVVLVRNVIERRPELALLSALGFTPGAKTWMVLCENLYLLALGLGVGALCALLGILPAVIKSGNGVAVGPLLLTLAAVATIGVAASAIAVRVSGIGARPADLRSE